MLMQEIRTIARDRGVKPGKLNKANLIRTIQKEEGNFDCFGTAAMACDQDRCLWRSDCLTPVRKR